MKLPRLLGACLLLACSAPTHAPTRSDAGAGVAHGGDSGTSGSAGTGGSPGTQVGVAADGGQGNALAHDAEVIDSGGGNAALDAATTGDAAAPGPGEGLVGWASVMGDGDPTTTGGAAGKVVTAHTAQELLDYAASQEPLIIQLSGTLTAPSVIVSSNKTLLGIGTKATLHGGLRIRGKSDALVHNVIIANLHVDASSSGVDGDGVQIHYAHHVWVDHCDIHDAADGNLDIVHASNWVTVSYTQFHYTSAAPDPKHRFSNLIGHTDDNPEDVGRLKVSFHHDHWADGVIERMPRVRHGQVHVWNSLYTAQGNNYAIGAAFESQLVVENNVFDMVKDPHLFYGGEKTAQMVATGNLYMSTTGKQDAGQGAAFKPPYPYTLLPAAQVASFVQANVGPR